METSPTTTTLTAKDPIAGIQTGMLFSGFMKCFSNASKIQPISAKPKTVNTASGSA